MESLVSLVLLVMVASGAGILMSSNIETNRRVSREAAAINLALDRLEEMRATGGGSVAGYNGLASSDAAETLSISGEAWSADDGPPFTRSWTVTEDTPTNGTKTLVVTVSWAETDGTDAVSISSVIKLP